MSSDLHVSVPIFYCKDTRRWYDTVLYRVVNKRELQGATASYDHRYLDGSLFDQFQAARLGSPVLESDLKKLKPKQDKPQRVRAEDLYQEAAHAIPLRMYLGKGSVAAYYYISEHNEATLLHTSDTLSLYQKLVSYRRVYDALRDCYESSEVLQNSASNISLAEYILKLIEQFKLDPDKMLEREPKLISWDPSVLAFKQFDPSLLQPGDTPTWDEFTSRLDYPEVFMAWVWSCFLENHEGRQMLWLVGPGNDGKSAVIKALVQLYGEQNSAALTKGEDSQFFFSTVYGKGLIAYSDCKNVHLISTAKIQNITGGDTVPVEFKNQQPFLGKVYSKIIVASNSLPQVDFNRNNEASRFIMLTVEPPKGRRTSDFEARLVREGYAFLHKCAQVYPKYIDPEYSDRDLAIPPELRAKNKQDCTSQNSRLLQKFVKERCELGEGYIYPIDDFRNDIMTFIMAKNRSSSDTNLIVQNFEDSFSKTNIRKKQVEELFSIDWVYEGIRPKQETK